MTTSVSAAEARIRFSELLGQVAFGDHEFVITRKGRPMARLVPVDTDQNAKVPSAVPERHPLFTANELGFPMLRNRKGVVVTEKIINRIREAEGI